MSIITFYFQYEEIKRHDVQNACNISRQENFNSDDTNSFGQKSSYVVTNVIYCLKLFENVKFVLNVASKKHLSTRATECHNSSTLIDLSQLILGIKCKLFCL